MAYDDRMSMDSWFPKADPVATDMIHRFTFYMEGESDVRFYEKFFKKLRFRNCGGKGVVLGYREDYLSTGEAEGSDGTECCFCVDRDFDAKVGMDQIDDMERILFYQLTKRAREGGFNDLECMQLRSKLVKWTLDLKYGIYGDEADAMLRSAVKAAAIVGCYRIANRFMKGPSTKDILWQFLDKRDPIEPERDVGKSEIGPYLLFKHGAAVVRGGLVEIDEAKLQQVLRQTCGRSYGYGVGRDSDVECAIREAEKIRQEIKDGNDIDYCRGHDITYFLCAQLKSRKGGCGANNRGMVPNNRADLEDKIASVLNNEKIYSECLKFISGYEFVEKLKEVSG